MIKSRARALAKLTPMAHQVVSLKHDKTTPIVFDTSDPGTGKTAVRIWAFAERRRKRGGCALVLAQRTLLTSVWANDFAKFAPDMKVSVATADNRAEAFAEDADVYVTNTDAAKWLAAQKPAFFQRFSELIVDESTFYKHSTSQRSRALARITKHFKRRACLTGTPNGNSICDVWHQVYLLDNGKRLGPNFYAFRQSVSIPEQVGRKREAVRWVDKDGAEEAVFGLLTDITIRHKFEDCIDIPSNQLRVIDFKLPPKLRKVYDAMERDHVVPLTAQMSVKARLTGKPLELTGVNAAAVGQKLLQIASGAVYDNDKLVREFDDSRYKLVMDLAEERRHTVIFYFWAHQLANLEREAKARDMAYAVINGATGDTARAAIVNAYQMGKYRTVFIHPKIGAHGLTLTKGTATIWPGPTADAEIFTQANKRIYRLGQKLKTETIMVLADTAVEQRVYHDILMGKDKRMKTFLDLFAAMTAEMKLAA